VKKLSVLTLSIVLSVGSLLPAGVASAAGFNQNRIIDDGVFDNTNTMNAAQIDSFLNSFADSCISPNSGFKAIDPTGYNPTDGYLYGGFVTAGQVIYDAGQAYGLNPQVLLTTLQKEQSLVVGGAGYCNNGDQHKYAAAVGYGCPDSGTTYSYTGLNLYQRNGVTITDTGTTCVNSAAKAGFSQQIIRAAWLLKFGEQRSKGSISWAVIKGNWNNSDDPQTCYGGPMTQGTFQRCPSGATTYYDGYTTIDSTAVHMDTGGTAALYWYTPHFSGNQHFYDIFTGWFGSTQFPQPIGAALYYQQSTGKIFLVTNSTRYYIPSWSLMINYGFDVYPAAPADDATIASFNDGGTLTNLIWDSGGVYLVNNGVRYHMSADACTAWGQSCFDNTQVKALGSVFQTQYLQTGWELGDLSAADGTIYKLSGGQKQPIANPKTLSDLGLSDQPVLVVSESNAAQPLGTLLMTTPGVVQFSPSPVIYFYDGSAYYAVGDMNIYNDWNLRNALQLSVPKSSYNTTPPVSTPLATYFQDSSGNKFVIDQGRRVSITSEFQSSWNAITYSTAVPPALFNSLLPASMKQNIWTNPDFFILANGSKHYVSSYQDYIALGINTNNTLGLRANKLLQVPQGADALGDGKTVSLNDGSGKIYVVNNHKLTQIYAPNTFNAYGYNWGEVYGYPTSITGEYPIDTSTLLASKTDDGSFQITSGNKLYQLSASLAQDFGVINSKFTSVTNQTIKSSPVQLNSRFFRNPADGSIYYASGGAIHHVTSYASFIAYGGGKAPVLAIDTATLKCFMEAQPI
jgi:hypothetical protein